MLDDLNATFSQVRKGDEFSFLGTRREVAGAYTAMSDQRPSDTRPGEFEVDADFTPSGWGQRHKTQPVVAPPEHTCHIFNRDPNKENDTVLSSTDRNNNEAKLELAADHDLQAKFEYTNLSGETHTVRLKPDSVWSDYSGQVLVGGESYDESGRPEGYKQYRIESIQDRVVIR